MALRIDPTHGRNMLMLSPLADLLDLQNGVVARRQVLPLQGESEGTIRRRLRRREWAVLLPGVYVEHTGTPTWKQRAWAATLYASPAALAGASALRAVDGPGRRNHADDAPIEVVIDGDRRVRDQPGVRVRRCEEFDAVVQDNTSPPRVQVEHAAIDAAAAAPTDLGSIAVLSDVIRSRRTTAERLLRAVRDPKRLKRRHLIESVLSDAAGGASSVLEMEFLRRVIRPHGLPAGSRQRREITGGAVQPSSAYIVYRDNTLDELNRIIELDGRIGHSSTTERDADFERDLDAALDGRETLRLGWGQVCVRSCATAAKLYLLLRKLGWQGEFTTCARCPADLVIPAIGQQEDAGNSVPRSDSKFPA